MLLDNVSVKVAICPVCFVPRHVNIESNKKGTELSALSYRLQVLIAVFTKHLTAQTYSL